MRDSMKVCIDKRNPVRNCTPNVNASLLPSDLELGSHLKHFLRHEHEPTKFICLLLELLADSVTCNIQNLGMMPQ